MVTLARAVPGSIQRRSGASRVLVTDRLADLDRAAWQRLVERSGAPVFYSWNFLASIEKLPLTAGAQPYYLALGDPGGELLAATVVHAQQAANPFGAAGGGAEPMLVGHLWHCYDSRLLSAVGLSSGLVTAFGQALDRLAEQLGMRSRGLHNLDRDGELAAVLDPCRLTTGPVRYRLLPRPGEDLATHLQGIGRASRRTMRKYRQRAAAAGVRVRFAAARDGLDADVLALCQATADKHAPGYYPPAALGQLLESLDEDCRILRVELDGELLACSICLFDARAAHFWAGGSRYPTELNWSPQYVLFAAELEHGFATGRPVLEFGRRNDEFKSRFGLLPRQLVSWVWR
jgi:predicted N-acyltransferase